MSDWIALLSKRAWLLVPLLVPVAVVAGFIQGAPAAILVLLGAALVSVIALFWASVRTLVGETPLSGADAYAIAAPRAEEEQKQAVLRALKDLEFERSVGKISDEDYNSLVTKYRAEAKRLLRVLEEDARPRRERVIGLVHERLVAAGLADAASAPVPEVPPVPEPAAAEPKAGKKAKKKKKGKGAEKAENKAEEGTVEIIPDPDAKPEDAKAKAVKPAEVDTTWRSVLATTTKESPAYTPPSKKCSACGTKNDPDAVFCKKCGSKAFKGDSVKVEKAASVDDDTKESAVDDEAAADEAAEEEAAAEEAEAGERAREGSK